MSSLARLLSGVTYLANASPEFYLQLSKCLHPRGYAQREVVWSSNLHVIHVGMAAVDGVIKLRGQAWNEDMIVASAELRRRSPACALTFLECFELELHVLEHIASHFPVHYKAIRKAAALLALRRWLLRNLHQSQCSQRRPTRTATRRSRCPAASGASPRCRRWRPRSARDPPSIASEVPTPHVPAATRLRDPAAAVLARQDRQGVQRATANLRDLVAPPGASPTSQRSMMNSSYLFSPRSSAQRETATVGFGDGWDASAASARFIQGVNSAAGAAPESSAVAAAAGVSPELSSTTPISLGAPSSQYANAVWGDDLRHSALDPAEASARVSGRTPPSPASPPPPPPPARGADRPACCQTCPASRGKCRRDRR